jgi:hypothetical protein
MPHAHPILALHSLSTSEENHATEYELEDWFDEKRNLFSIIKILSHHSHFGSVDEISKQYTEQTRPRTENKIMIILNRSRQTMSSVTRR